MSERIFTTLPATAAGVAQGADVLRAGGLVAFPTETVYGLGADARSDLAVAGIFAAKDRPAFNPLIVHVASLAEAERYCAFTADAERLASTFWPGALTLVLPLRDGTGISHLVTAGQQSLAIRVPGHPLALDFLRAFGGPVAAPSANPSGRISPTSAAHVKAGLQGRIDAVLDGGECQVGLESTIIGCLGQPVLLRAGGLPVESIEACLGFALARAARKGAPIAPGQLASHYAPKGTLRLNVTEAHDDEVLLGFGPVTATLNLSPSGDLAEAAVNLFGHLHKLDAMGVAHIAVSPIPMTGLGLAINDRLARAAAPRP